jgi:protein SCO1
MKLETGQEPAGAGKGVTRLWVAGFTSLILVLVVIGLLMPGTLTREQARELGFYQFDVPRRIADFSLIDQTGTAVGLDEFQGQWSLLFFGYTYCPDICPITLSLLGKTVEGLENPPQVVLVSVDPERDTPARLADYLQGFSSGFRGFTGELDEIESLAVQVNIALGKVPGADLETYLVSHTASLVVVNPEGQYEGFIKDPHQAQNIRSILGYLRHQQ